MSQDAIKQIQEARASKLIVYFTGDRQLATARIAEDAVRPLYEHLLSVGKKQRIDLFLYSRGGDVSVPWRIISMFREFCGEFSVLVPYKAHSAATLISLGADKIVMGKKAELSPIDPALVKVMAGETAGQHQEISVEDVNSFISFMKERVGIKDQTALAQITSILANNLTPLTLGSVNRQNSHIRLVAKKLLISRKEKIGKKKINSIIETLTEKMYSHGHAIGRKEAQEIGLPIEMPDEDLETLIWKLYLEYEKLFKLDQPIDPILVLADKEEELLKDVPFAAIESEGKRHLFESQIAFKRERRVPTNPQININFQMSLPPNIQPDSIPQQAQQILQQMINKVSQEITRLVQKEMVRQSPETGINIRAYGGCWNER